MEYIYIYIYIYTSISKIKTVQQNKVQQIDLANKGKQKLYLPVKNKTKLKHKLENKTKAMCQVGYKAMKTKLANMLRGKEGKKRRKE